MANALKHRDRSHRSYRSNVYKKYAAINSLWKNASTKIKYQHGELFDLLRRFFKRKRG